MRQPNVRMALNPHELPATTIRVLRFFFAAHARRGGLQNAGRTTVRRNRIRPGLAVFQLMDLPGSLLASRPGDGRSIVARKAAARFRCINRLVIVRKIDQRSFASLRDDLVQSREQPGNNGASRRIRTFSGNVRPAGCRSELIVPVFNSRVARSPTSAWKRIRASRLRKTWRTERRRTRSIQRRRAEIRKPHDATLQHRTRWVQDVQPNDAPKSDGPVVVGSGQGRQQAGAH